MRGWTRVWVGYDDDGGGDDDDDQYYDHNKNNNNNYNNNNHNNNNSRDAQSAAAFHVRPCPLGERRDHIALSATTARQNGAD